MGTYAQFVKAHYADVTHLPRMDRFAAIAKMWAAEGHTAKAKPKKGSKGGFLSAAGLEDRTAFIKAELEKMGLGRK